MVLIQIFFLSVTHSGLTKWRPEVQPVGFFPDKALAIKDKTQVMLRPDGFVPNSILVRLMWPQTAIETQRDKKKYTPPEITEFYDSVCVNLFQALGSWANLQHVCVCLCVDCSVPCSNEYIRGLLRTYDMGTTFVMYYQGW